MTVQNRDDLPAGTIVLEKYEIIEKLSDEGYTSVVFKARQIGLEQDCAVKILRHERLNEPAISAQLQKEVKRQAVLNHTNIVKIIDHGEYNGRPVVVQEFVDGGNLRNWLKEVKTAPPPFTSFIQILDNLLSAVSYMHNRGLMHMDIKPENILVSTDGSFRLADFGLAKQQGGATETNIFGTLSYMHPDLLGVTALPREQLEPKFDCYSIGCLIDNDLLCIIEKIANKDDYIFLKLIAQKAKNNKGEHYNSIDEIKQDLQKLNRSLDVKELPHQSSFIATLRVPPEISVSITSRVIKIIDSTYFQRLRYIKQLGPISFVYPGATHTRFEHSLGCYNYARNYLDVLLREPRFRFSVSESDVLAVLAAALLHDIGHYPYCHAVHDAYNLLRHNTTLPQLNHEQLAKDIIFEDGLPAEVRKTLENNDGPLAEILEKDWGVDPELVCRLIKGVRHDPKESLLSSIINGPIDADKMDYLERDSIHAGVPYGRYIDKSRFFASLTLNKNETSICLTDKGRIAAETFIFCRYAMTSEVYWHHTARAANAMIVNAIKVLIQNRQINSDSLLKTLLLSNDQTLLEQLSKVGQANVASMLLNALIFPNRKIYKRLVTYSKAYSNENIYNTLINDYETLDRIELQNAINTKIIELVNDKVKLTSLPGESQHIALLDVPPRNRDIVPMPEIYYRSVDKYYRLVDTSNIAKGLGEGFQFNVKKVRVFCRDDIASVLRRDPALFEELNDFLRDRLASHR